MMSLYMSAHSQGLKVKEGRSEILFNIRILKNIFRCEASLLVGVSVGRSVV